GAETFDLPLHVEPGLVDRIPQARPGIAAHHQAAALSHEGAHVADRAADHDVHALHGDAAARAGIALDHHQPAMAGGRRRLGSVALHPDLAGHDVLGDADAAVAVHHDLGLLVHAGAVIAGMAF